MKMTNTQYINALITIIANDRSDQSDTGKVIDAKNLLWEVEKHLVNEKRK